MEEFIGDRGIRLIKAGVKEEQLISAKAKYPKDVPNIDIEKIEFIPAVNQTIISVGKIINMGGRASNELSWYDNFECNNNYSDTKLNKLLTSLESKGLEEFKDSFLVDQKEDINVVYYEDSDYYIVEEGKHRATMAIVMGLEWIKAKVCICRIESGEYLKHQNYGAKIDKLTRMTDETIRFLDGCKIDDKEELFGKRRRQLIRGDEIIFEIEYFNDYFNDTGELSRGIEVIRKINELLKNVSSKKSNTGRAFCLRMSKIEDDTVGHFRDWLSKGTHKKMRVET